MNNIRTIYCRTCAGSGKLSSGGMMILDCNGCGGHGYVDVPEESNTGAKYSRKVVDKKIIDKRSVAYRDGIREIMNLYPDISLEEAKIVFDKELEEVS